VATTASRPRPLIRASPVNWRVALLRIPLNALAVFLTVLMLPGLHVTTGNPVLGYLALGLVFGALNAFVKPALQFVALPFLFSSFGLVVLVVDAVVFGLLDLTRLLSSDRFFWIVVGGAVVGLLSFVFENLVGLTPPIVEEQRS
jgi:putative membrane protein